MARIEWDASLSVGIPLIDAQHKSLIDRLQAVSKAVEARQGAQEIATTLIFLVDYAEFHFLAEETHMALHNYPGLDEQKAAHAEFMDTLRDLLQDFHDEGSTSLLAEAVNTFLSNWLGDHIRKIDSKFGSFLSEKGIAIAEGA